MKAIFFTGKNQVRFEETETPAANGDRILIETIYSGISWGTETAWLTRKMPFDYGTIPGYLSVGRVLHVGKDTGRGDLSEGMIVWAGGNHGQFINQVPQVVQPLPEGIDLKAICFCHLAAIGLHCLNRVGSIAGETLYVAGQGFLGQLTAQVGQVIGMKVFASEIDPNRLEMSRKFSCDNIFKADDPVLKEQIEELGGVDVIVNSTGVANLEDDLIPLLGRHGRLVVQGMTPRVNFDLYATLEKQISVVVSADSTSEEDIECIDFISKGKLRILPLVTTVVSPEKAVPLYTGDRNRVLGTVIDWGQLK